MFEEYLAALLKTAKAGDAREESFYPDLKRLLERWIEQRKGRQHVTQLPKKTEGGNPDFRVWDGRAKIVGYIEAKDPKTEDLDVVERSEQLKRYRSTFPNFILTNFFEFRLYRNGELAKNVQIGRPFLVHRVRVVPPVENEPGFLGLLEQFFAFSIPKTTTARTLATELATRTRFLRDAVIAEEMMEGRDEGIQTLEAFHQAFKRHLIASLSPQDFSDLFAQTITYGLFAARSRANGDFNRRTAIEYIPATIGILRKVFQFISSTDLPKPMEWIIDDIAEVLAESNVKKIIHGFFEEGKGKDPIVHFYETFLAVYDPKLREKRGVYYTPEPVVGYITRSIHKLLKSEFGKEDGFASSDVTVLDPAAGTLTFPAAAINLAVQEFKRKYGEGGVPRLIEEHILCDFYAFELMMAPYAVGHLKIGFVLDELGYTLKKNERFNLYLTNTLDFEKDEGRFPGVFEQTLAEESAEALKVKEKVPVMVIMGNPPYSGVSENKGEWITEKIEDYKQVDGKPLGERNPKWLQDDYVKFFRFAQWKIEQAGHGVLGFITNHAWLDNPTFRGMRASLLNTFDEAYILNLHGSTLKKEKTPEGGKDENVFDIQPGVAIVLFVKIGKSLKKKAFFYADRWGLRQEKYDWLDDYELSTTKWSAITPSSPYYFLILREEEGWDQYQGFWKVTDIFPVNSVGIVTGRDEFVIDDDRQALESRIRIFRDSKDDDEFMKNAYRLKDKPASRWTVNKARQQLQEDQDWDKCFSEVLYRPFDKKWIFYHPSVIERGRKEVMQHMLQPNLALLAKRQQKQKFSYTFVTDKIAESCVFESAYANNSVFPLYLYNDSEKSKQTSMLVKDSHTTSRKPNINPKLLATLKNVFPKVQVENIFFYIYAVLYSNVYRNKYAEFLKIDFPRIPFTKDSKLFQKLADLGEQLVQFHLLKSAPSDNRLSAQLVGKGSAGIVKVERKSNEVWINDEQRFTPVPEDAWDYYIGGYQVLHKWLKDRKGRVLSAEEIKTYCRIVAAIRATMEIQKEIDRLYPEVEKSLIETKSEQLA
ncbi:MAG: DNA methyltransferase [Candidatus Kerfeldbacteria bacterium]|nr:DNA methyltransferase [Candidatus Kerfeldbacteria bacterium]